MSIREATPDDARWLKPLFDPALFWDFGRIWWRYWHQRAKGEQWLVLPEKGFVHYHHRPYGRVIQEIAVETSFRQQGIGRQLVEAVGYPVYLKTDLENVTAQAFYQRLGFRCEGRHRSKSGKEMVAYVKYS